MRQRRFRATALTLMAFAGSACGAAAPSPPPSPAAATFEEYAVALCSAFDSMFNAVGNPDTGSASVLSKSLDEAVAAGDAASAERLAAEITTEREAGRHQAELAGRWPSASPMTVQLDRVLVAFEAMTTAKTSEGE